MSDYVAKGGTTALGVIGTTLGSLATLGNLGRWGNTYNANGGICERDLCFLNQISQKDSEIAQYKSEKYADNVGLELYKYIDGRLRGIEETISENNTTQLLVNEKLTSANVALATQLTQIAKVVGDITGTAVKQNMVVDFGCCCG